jgi:DNA end-binding protein Ku
MPRVLWKGAISFGLVNIPINLYSADSRNELDFTMLDRRTMSPVGYQRINKETGKDVPWEEIVKGYEYEKGKYVVLGEEDFRLANVEATQTIEIVAFMDADQIPPVYYETPYYVTPGKRGEKGYALLRETLKRTNKVALAQVVIRTRQSLAALYPMEDMLVLNLIRYADELRRINEYEVPPSGLKAVGIDPKEMAIATRLVDSMTEDWNPGKYHDTYREDLLALIEKKIKAGDRFKICPPTAPGPEEEREKGKVVDLMALLKRSVEEKAKEPTIRSRARKKQRHRESA